MIKFLNNTKFLFLLFLTTSCSQILEPVQFDFKSSNAISKLEDQDSLNVVIKSLTLEEAKKSSIAPYKRELKVYGKGLKANVYDELLLSKVYLPPEEKPKEYLLGLGDELRFLQIQDNETILSNTSNSSYPTALDVLINSSSSVGTDGSILLLGLGRINAGGKSINEVRDEARNILIRDGRAPNFQLEITDFNSRKALLFKDGLSQVITLTNKPISLREAFANAQIFKKPEVFSLIKINRDSNEYTMTDDELYDSKRPNIFIQNNDVIEVVDYSYKPGQVFTLSGSSAAKIIRIDPAIRESMADILFLENGPLSNRSAKRSEIYLLRGNDPMTAYHLDAQRISKLLVASKMELRPNDIIFTAERPIISFNRILQEITPLRALLRDIKNDNIP
jgi:polysaccharide biosynthesis/export protein